MPPHSLNQIGPYCFEIPKQGSMRVPARFFGAPALIEAIDAKVFEQAANVACLPGIVKASLAMPDAHWGYGFPIGGVAAFDPERGGVISVGGVGYDISCGVRTMRTGLHREEVEPVLEALVDELFRNIPAGVGSEGLLKLSGAKLDEALQGGAAWAVRNGFGTRSDLEFIEDQGRVSGGNPDKVSDTAKKRQKRQIGTLGSGNHYLEVQHVSRIFDGPAAQAFGLVEGDVVVTLHCGSRALGHQIGTDYLNTLGRAANKYSISLPERELVCAPIDSPEGRDYFEAMVCGINCALANRQVLGHLVRDSFERVLPQARLSVLYDISHNTCKEETHEVQGSKRTLYVHRKGATRAFGPGREELPARYRQAGQPVIIGGTMGTASYILCGLEQGQEMAWGSACHGAGRAMSRRQALKRWKSKDVIEDLREQGILIRAASKKGAAEEAPQAYKDVDLVVDSTHAAGLAKKVAQLKPLACIKG